MTLTSVSTLEREPRTGLAPVSRKRPASERDRYIQIVARRLQFSGSTCYRAFNDARHMSKEDLQKVSVEGTAFEPIQRIFELLRRPAIQTDGTIGGIMHSPLTLSAGEVKKLICTEGETITGSVLAIRLLMLINPTGSDEN